LEIDYEFLNSLCEDVLAKDDSIQWTGIVNRNGVILAQKTKEGIEVLLTEEENEEYASSAIARQKTRAKFEPKIGKMIYAFGRYERLNRATIPIMENYYLLITMGVEEKNFDSIITDRIVPALTERRSRFKTGQF
jgi:hypothetical protein